MNVEKLRNKRSILLATVVVSITVIAAATWFVMHTGDGGVEGQGSAQGFAMPVEVAAVRLDTVVQKVEAIGTLRANESVMIRPELDGRVVAVHFAEGHRIKQGDMLVTLDASIAQAELDQARAALNLSETNYQRAKKLMQRGAGSVSARDDTLSQLKVNRAAVVLAQARLQKMIIKAPFDGTLGLRKIGVGDYLIPGQDIVNLVNIDLVKVDFRVAEIYLVDVKEGQDIEVRLDALPNEVFAGEVYAIDPQLDVNGRSIVIRAVIPNSDRRLRPGLFARVQLITNRQENARLVPEEALVPQGDKQYVYRVVDGKAVMTEVMLGIRQGTNVVIQNGLAADAMVVTGGQMKIRDGMPVSAIPAIDTGESKQDKVEG